MSLHVMVLLSPLLPGSRSWSCNYELSIENRPVEGGQLEKKREEYTLWR